MSEKIAKFETKKSLGQHFLNSSRVPELMAEAGNIEKGDVVLEIGPGTGVLTRELLKRGAIVTAIEADLRAIETLQESFGTEIMAKTLTILHGDVREIDLKALGLRPHAFKIVANIPYYLSGFLFRTFLEHKIQPSNLVFLVQREVAERIARDKKESLLSLSVKVFGDPKYIKTIGKGNFTPPPKIDSAIIAISNISKDRLAEIHQEFFFKILHEGFKSKRKQLLGNLSDTYERDILTHIFSTLPLSLTIRGEDVSLDMWLRLCSALILHTDRT
ncbi:MAG: 16S rRNA (adenine(1518)-N(6)/adenine(1519)-N(6))-dimethyltransferase RsmA [Minisyncoccia bacterium]